MTSVTFRRSLAVVLGVVLAGASLASVASADPDDCIVEPCSSPGFPDGSFEPVPPREGADPLPLEPCPTFANPLPPQPSNAVGVFSIVCSGPADPQPDPVPSPTWPLPATAALAAPALQTEYEVEIGYASTSAYSQVLNGRLMFLGHELRIFAVHDEVIRFEGVIDGICGFMRPGQARPAQRGITHSFAGLPIGDVFTSSSVFANPEPVVHGSNATAVMTAIGLSAEVASPAPGGMSKLYRVKAYMSPIRMRIPQD